MDDKPKLFLLFPGPKYNLRDDFEDRCKYLSQNFRGTILTSGPSDKVERYSGFEVICVKDRFAKSFISTLKFFFYSIFLIFKARLSRDSFKIFVTYDPLKTGLIGAFVSWLGRLKLVVEVNGDYTQDVIYWGISNPIKRRIKKRLMLAVEQFVLGRCAGIKLLYDTQIDSFLPLKKNPVIKRFPDYVNASNFQTFSEEKIVLTAGFPFWIKGIDILISAFKLISEDYPEWKLKILGYYPNKDILNEYMGGDPKIFHHEPIDHTLMPEHIGRCGVFVLASRTEAMGRVLVEAMAAGKPRIGANVGGIPTVIDDEVDGLLFENGSVDDLANKLKILLSSCELRQQYGSKAKARYQSEFSPIHYFEKLGQFYQNVLER